LESIVVFLFPLRIKATRYDIFHPVDRHGSHDIMMQQRRTIRELGDQHPMRDRACVVGEELAVVDEEVGVLAGVHGFAVVVYEGLFCTWWGSRVPFDGVSPSGGKGVASGYPAVKFIFRGGIDVDNCDLCVC
jgi:hypothetical protein